MFQKLLGKTEAASKAAPTGAIPDSFRDYIHNEIPARFIDTSEQRFVSRKDVFRIFQDQIASVTEAQIEERIQSFSNSPFSTYPPRRETVLRQIIQETVRYVILSHRWDETVGEPTYRDIPGGIWGVARFKKLAQFLKTSKKLGYRLAWVDTCCMDQTNNTELSEGIHAMYKWYANSYLCIVHLAGSVSYADWDGELWFTRGWTLQELLAPKRLKFYGKDWQPFTTPDIIDDRKYDPTILHLHKATGIPKTVLTADNSQGVQGRSFWEIMSWSSKRQTTRVEDRAYCLIGLFCVNLLISYGEGQQAFPRLVEAIMAKNPSWDVFAWCGQPSGNHFSIPSSPASYPKFEVHMSEDRVGVRGLSLSRDGLSLMSLPPIAMELFSVVKPEGPRMPFRITLRPCLDSSLGTFGDLVVNCGSTRLGTIRCARRLSACIINHHASGTRRREEREGRLIVGREYICFLLYSVDEDDEERTWMKLHTDNLLRMSFVGVPEAGGGENGGVTDGVTLPLVKTSIHSCVAPA